MYVYSFTHSLTMPPLNVSVCLIGTFQKFAHIWSTIIWDSPQWLPVPQHIQFKISTLLQICLVRVAPSKYKTFCTWASSDSGPSTLHSVMVVPHMCGWGRSLLNLAALLTLVLLAGTNFCINCTLNSSSSLFSTLFHIIWTSISEVHFIC